MDKRAWGATVLVVAELDTTKQHLCIFPSKWLCKQVLLLESQFAVNRLRSIGKSRNVSVPPQRCKKQFKAK